EHSLRKWQGFAGCAGLAGAQASRSPQKGRADRERAPGTPGISEFEVNGQLHLPGVKSLYVLIKPGQRGRPISPNRIEQHREAPPAGDPRNPPFEEGARPDRYAPSHRRKRSLRIRRLM